jgi:dolichol-phosphate mannosyltransferase
VKLSIVIPAHNEAGCIGRTVEDLVGVLIREALAHEIVVVNDHSTDDTAAVVKALCRRFETVRCVENDDQPGGYGFAVRKGLEVYTGDAAAVMMGDESDSPEDLVVYHRKLCEGYDCVFGSRFIRGSQVIDYPAHKLVLNRMANAFIRLLFGIRYNDVTNAFKCYRRQVIDGVQPLLSHHFNLTVELPLKAIVRGYSYAVVPIRWTNRTTGVSKLKIREMGSRYMFIVLYAFLEKHLSRGDYRRRR